MKQQYFILFGLVFLLLLMGLASAQYNWATFGNGYTPLWNEQYQSATSRFDLGVTTKTISAGQSYANLNIPYQPLVSGLGNPSGKQYLIFPNGNYLQIYDKDLNLVQETFSSPALAQIDVADFNADGYDNEIVGWFNIGGGKIAFRSYIFNYSKGTISLDYEQNFSVSGTYGVAGIRCSSGKECYSIMYYLTGANYILNWTIINKTSTVITTLPIVSAQKPLEPVSWYDYDGDGKTEWFVFTANKMLLFERDGTVNVEINFTGTITGAKMFKPDASNIWKIAMLYDVTFYTYVAVYKQDGIGLWNNQIAFYNGFAQRNCSGNGLAISNDYDGDGYPDIYVVATRSTDGAGTITFDTKFAVFKGNDGSGLYSRVISSPLISFGYYPHSMITIANMDNDIYMDFIAVSGTTFGVFSPAKDTYLNYSAISPSPIACVPADLNLDGLQEVICSGSGITKVFASNYSNQNPIINSIAYSPSTSIARYTTLNAVVSATDSEGNLIYYKSKCSDSLNWSAEDNNAVRTCYYGDIGSFNLTVAVRDFYHSTYNYFSQIIIVTETGTVCGNDICEAGENNANCPADCPSNVTQIQATETGGMPLPTKLVDTTNIEQGLLPEVYYGILGFLSNTLSPIMILVFVIFFVMIILALGFIIKKIFHRVGDLAK